MVVTKLRTGVERRVAERRLRRSAPALTVSVPKDEGNAFSLLDAAVEPGILAVSFDFFDTLAFRRHLPLADVLRKTAALAADLVPGDRARAFRKVVGARGFTAAALKRALVRQGSGDEPPLEAVLARALEPLVPEAAARARLVARLVALETEVELRNLEANDEALPTFRALRAAGLTVAITSDMYLPQAAMARIVEGLGFAPYVDRLFVSADLGVTKHGGGIYPIVARELGLEPSRILHIGDNWHGDVVQARKQGFKALHYVSAAEHTAQRRLAHRAAVARSADLERDDLRRAYRFAATRRLPDLEAITDEVIGPACGLFVADVLMAAERRGSSDVYFLTRDGTIFHEIAETARAAVPALFGADARLRLLAASRSTGHFLRNAVLDTRDLVLNTEFLMQAPFTLARLFQLCDLEQADFAACPGPVRDTIAAAWTKEDQQPFLELMHRRPAFRATLKSGLDRKRAEVAGYLGQEGLFDARAPVLADIGYSGTWAKQLSVLFEQRETAGQSVPHCEFRFFASNRFFDRNLDALHPSVETVPGFMLDHRDAACLRAALNFAWLEPFFVDPGLGRFHGYRHDGTGKQQAFEPVFDPAPFAPEDRARLEARRARIVARAAEVIDDFLRHPGDLPALRDLVRARLVALADRPRRAEVRAINRLAHQRGMKTVTEQPVARRFYPNGLARKIVWLRDHDYWVQGSLALSGLGLLTPLLALHPSLNPLSPREPAR